MSEASSSNSCCYRRRLWRFRQLHYRRIFKQQRRWRSRQWYLPPGAGAATCTGQTGSSATVRCRLGRAGVHPGRSQELEACSQGLWALHPRRPPVASKIPLPQYARQTHLEYVLEFGRRSGAILCEDIGDDVGLAVARAWKGNWRALPVRIRRKLRPFEHRLNRPMHRVRSRYGRACWSYVSDCYDLVMFRAHF